ncbi:MAG TPA: hypothetical protein VGM33_11720 [Baekduia sp.]|jgi:hypothetical protein
MSDLYLVFSERPASVSAEDYDRWYREHLSENLGAPGFDAGQRFALQHMVAQDRDSFHHLAVYETTGTMEELRAGLDRRITSGEVVLPDWFKDIRFSSWRATSLDERVVADE